MLMHFSIKRDCFNEIYMYIYICVFTLIGLILMNIFDQTTLTLDLDAEFADLVRGVPTKTQGSTAAHGLKFGGSRASC